MCRLIPLTVIAFIALGAILSSCESKITDNPCDTCGIPCDTCDTTDPCDTCDTTKGDPDSLAHAFTWTEYTIPDEVKLTGAWVFNDNLIYVMGDKLWRWNGTIWEREKVFIYQTQREAGFADDSYFALSPTDMWIVGGIAYHYYDGSADEFRGDSVYRGARACWGISSDDMFLVGDSGRIYHYDGQKFSKFPQITTKPLYSVWGTSHNDVWAAGFNESTAQSVLLHFDGASWSEQDLKQIGDIRPLSHALGEVWATDSAGHKIVVTSGSLLHRRTDNGPWRSDSGLIQNRLNDGYFIGLWDVRGNNINDFCAAGDGGFISHWNGKSWKRYDELYNPNDIFYITRAIHQKGNTVCVVGKKNGASWIAIGRRKP
jgi:hypothetical protein